MEPDSEQYYLKLAAAFVRGHDIQGDSVELPTDLREKPLDDLAAEELAAVFRYGLHAGLKLHKFKKTAELPRVRRVFGALRSLVPENLLDIGSGRGVFLWPLLDQFPELPVTAIDSDEVRASDLEAVRRGGIERLTAHEMDVTDLTFDTDAFDVTTALEVLEHIPAITRAVAELVRVTRRFVIVSAPSKPDDNPQHIHLLDETKLRELFAEAGVNPVSCDCVRSHIIAVANVQAESC